MKRHLIVLATACLLLPLALTACGGSSSSDSTSAAASASVDPDAAAKQAMLDDLRTEAAAEGIDPVAADCVVDGVSTWTLDQMIEADSGEMGDEVRAMWLDVLTSCNAVPASPAAS